MKASNMKVLKENTEEYLYDVRIGKDIRQYTESKNFKRKKRQNSSKLKASVHQTLLIKMNRQGILLLAENIQYTYI